MIPSKPLDYTKRSMEDEVFDSFKKNLPDEWYICHSFKIKDVDKYGESYESEIDFLIIIPDVAVVMVESKAGSIRFESGHGLSYNNKPVDYLWRHGDGKIMKYNGPFRQLDRSCRNFELYLNEGRAKIYGFGKKLSLLSIVCFPSLEQHQIDEWNLPSDAGSPKCIICGTDLFKKPGQLKDRILSAINYQIDTCFINKQGSPYIQPFRKLNEQETKIFIEKIVAPWCNLVPSPELFVDIKKQNLHSFLKSQTSILDYLEEQKIAVISGGAGTGKTMIALEKAKRLSEAGQKVLYLCYNSKLKEHLEKNYGKNALVTFENIDSLYKHYLGTIDNKNYNLLVGQMEKDKSFDYINFIVDEAQDYGKKEIEDSGFLFFLQSRAEENEGVCYFFYDKYQCIQSKEIPEVILEADCKLTLFNNCRNTTSIAKTSCTLFHEQEYKKKYIKGFENGNAPYAICTTVENNYEIVKRLVNYYRSKEYTDIVILTTKEIASSSLADLVKNEKITIDGYQCLFTTCRKFKGLEAEVIILVDVDGSILLNDEDRLLFYVGASRAKFELGIVFNASVQECSEVMTKFHSSLPLFGKSFGTFYTFFHATNGEKI